MGGGGRELKTCTAAIFRGPNEQQTRYYSNVTKRNLLQVALTAGKKNRTDCAALHVVLCNLDGGKAAHPEHVILCPTTVPPQRFQSAGNQRARAAPSARCRRRRRWHTLWSVSSDSGDRTAIYHPYVRGAHAFSFTPPPFSSWPDGLRNGEG